MTVRDHDHFFDRSSLLFDDWVAYGLQRGWIGPPVCSNHEGMPISSQEFEEPDRCVMVIRIYDSPDQRAEIETDHLPSRTNREIYLDNP